MARQPGILVLLAVCACEGETPPSHPLELRVEKREVEVGERFSLTVRRLFPRDAQLEELAPTLLEPLVVHLRDRRRTEHGAWTEEVLEYDAFALALADVSVGPFTTHARAPDGSELTARAPALALRVQRTLDPAAPGAPELPAAPFPEPRARYRPWIAAVTLMVLALLAGAAARRRRRPAPPSATPYTRARERLERLLAQASGDAAGTAEAAAAILREYLAGAFSVPAPARTSEQVLASAGRHATLREHQPELARILVPCDRVKFACHVPDAAERAELLHGLLEFLEGTAPA